MIKDAQLEQAGLIERTFPLEPLVVELLKAEKWKELDQYFLMAERPGGALFEFFVPLLEFSSMEHIIAIRSAPEDEDGIWHDDGSRRLGFSLSLTENHQQVVGGELRFRPKGQADFESISTRPLGTILIFKTGIYGFEHMVSAVTQGKRVVIAGWCS